MTIIICSWGGWRGPHLQDSERRTRLVQCHTCYAPDSCHEWLGGPLDGAGWIDDNIIVGGQHGLAKGHSCVN